MQKDGLVVITGGGSGGHTTTSLAVINELQKRCPKILDNLIYVGGNLGMEGDKKGVSLEERVATEHGIKFVKIRSGKFQRYLSLNSIRLMWGIVGGFIDSLKFFRRNIYSVQKRLKFRDGLGFGIFHDLFCGFGKRSKGSRSNWWGWRDFYLWHINLWNNRLLNNRNLFPSF